MCSEKDTSLEKSGESRLIYRRALHASRNKASRKMSGFAAEGASRPQSHLLADQATPFDYSDLVPVPQDDGPHPVVTIAYSAEYSRRMNLFRALLKCSELSPRALCLTEELLHDNASNYTVWQYRRECLRALSCDLGRELDYLDSNPDDNPKNYQIWHHRRVVVDELAGVDPQLCAGGERELAFTSEVFEVDPKNYHAWSHRQWACQRFGLWAGELGFTEALLRQDVRNNSAWNHRWFVVHRGKTSLAGTGGAAALAALSPEEAAAELYFCFARIDEARRNESPWNYLRGARPLSLSSSSAPSLSDTLSLSLIMYPYLPIKLLPRARLDLHRDRAAPWLRRARRRSGHRASPRPGPRGRRREQQPPGGGHARRPAAGRGHPGRGRQGCGRADAA